jgi:hypothetical protein
MPVFDDVNDGMIVVLDADPQMQTHIHVDVQTNLSLVFHLQVLPCQGCAFRQEEGVTPVKQSLMAWQAPDCRPQRPSLPRFSSSYDSSMVQLLSLSSCTGKSRQLIRDTINGFMSANNIIRETVTQAHYNLETIALLRKRNTDMQTEGLPGK